MNAQTLHDGTIESVYSDDDLGRADTAEPTPENTGNPAYSPAILKMVKKMRKGSIADNNKRSRNIVEALRMEREKKHSNKTAPSRRKQRQKTIVDF